MKSSTCQVRDLAEAEMDIAVALMSRFFAEEGFAGTAETITANTRRLWADPYHWIGLAWRDREAVGVITVTTMLYVAWGRLGEIGDLYVLPEARRNGHRGCLDRRRQREMPTVRVFRRLRDDHS